ncbi:MAG TPA: hypothetical protein VGD19_02900 [Allosphingosinicella sp.]|jgi:hypothetical protein
MTSIFSTRNLSWALIAIFATVALHGGWLAGMDRDALAVPAVAARA